MRYSKLHGEHNPEKILRAIKEGANPNATILNGITPLHWSRNAKTTKVLIQAGANVSSWDIQRDTPLHMAPDAESVSLLVAHGASVHARNKKGNTPLHTAKNVEVIKALVAHGADVNAHNTLNQTPLDTLDKRGAHLNMREALLALGGKQTRHTHVTHESALLRNDFINTTLSNLFLPSFFVVIAGLVFCFRKAQKIHAFFAVQTQSIFLFIALSFLLLLNPVALHLAFFINIAKDFFYVIQTTPQIITDSLLLPLSAYMVYHVLCVYRYRKKSQGYFSVYCAEQIPYITFFPYYIFLGTLPTSNDPSVGIFVIFCIPSFFIALFAGYMVSAKIKSPS